jgi:hypothetical protein
LVTAPLRVLDALAILPVMIAVCGTGQRPATGVPTDDQLFAGALMLVLWRLPTGALTSSAGPAGLKSARSLFSRRHPDSFATP